MLFPLKTAFIMGKVRTPQQGTHCCLYQTGAALNADFFTYDQIDKNITTLESYQLVIIVDIKDYRTMKGIPQRIRKLYPNMFMGYHQESEVNNLFTRHWHHDNRKYHPEAQFDISTLKVWEFIQACDFVICHNIPDVKFFSVFSGKPCFASNPFIAVDKITPFFQKREDKRKAIMIAGAFGKRDGGLLSLLIAGDTTFAIEGIRRNPINPTEQEEIFDVISNGFHKKPIKVHNTLSHDKYLKLLGSFYCGVYLMEATASRIVAHAACVGTPLVCNERSETSVILFPDLAIDKLDLVKGQYLLRKLISDKDFYEQCVYLAQTHLPSVGIPVGSKSLRDNIMAIYEG